jgi:hypothetical protein
MNYRLHSTSYMAQCCSQVRVEISCMDLVVSHARSHVHLTHVVLHGKTQDQGSTDDTRIHVACAACGTGAAAVRCCITYTSKW